MEGVIRFIFSMITAMAVACLLNSILVWLHITAAVMPIRMGTNVYEPGPVADRVKREDFLYPEVHVVDDLGRSVGGYVVRVVDEEPTAERAEYPMSF